jgi:hypothetical protein
MNATNGQSVTRTQLAEDEDAGWLGCFIGLVNDVAEGRMPAASGAISRLGRMGMRVVPDACEVATHPRRDEAVRWFAAMVTADEAGLPGDAARAKRALEGLGWYVIPVGNGPSVVDARLRADRRPKRSDRKPTASWPVRPL